MTTDWRAFAAALPPLRGSDGGFTRASIAERLPAILRETAASCARAGALPPAALAAVGELADALARNEPLAPLAAPQPEALYWDAPSAREHEGQRPLDVPWLWLENWVYKKLLDIVRESGAAAAAFDPFLWQKREAIAAAAPAFATVLPLAAAPKPDLRAALLRSLWGNRADLSLSAGVVERPGDAAADGAGAGGAASTSTPLQLAAEEAALLLSDDTAAAVELLRAAPPGGEVVVLLDNCGLELLSDLVLAHALLAGGAAARVTLLCKTAPVFVSDALEADLAPHVEAVASAGAGGAALAAALRGHLASGALRLECHAFFTSPCAWRDAPRDLLERLAPVTLAIVKGDANYRRLIGDAHWPYSTPFGAAVGFFAPCPLLALRTLKAGCGVGVPDEAAALAERAAADWRVSGRFGVAQLARPGDGGAGVGGVPSAQ